MHLPKSTSFVPARTDLAVKLLKCSEPSMMCVDTLKDGYVQNVPLPRAPRIQSANHVTSKKQVTIDSQDTCYLQVPRVPTWSNLTRLLAGWRKNILPFSPVWLM